MTFQYTIIVFVGLLNRSLAASSTDCLLGQYTTIDGNCIACPPGKAGTNCSEDCRNGTYGFKCAYTCECTDCDPVTGCPSTTINAVGMTELVTDVPPVEGPVHTVISLLLLMVLLVVILAIVGCNFAATLVLLLRFSTNLHLPQHQDKISKESTARGTVEEIEMNPDAYESPIIPTVRQEMRVYTELH